MNGRGPVRSINRWLIVMAMLGQSVSLCAQELTPFRVGVLSGIHHAEHTYAAQLLERSLSLHGYQMELISVPGKRLMSQLNRGEVDGDLLRSVDLSRGFEAIIRVNEPVGSSCLSVYRLRERADIIHGTEGQSPVLAVYHGAPGAYGFFSRYWPDVQLVHFSKLEQGVKMLTHERIDLIAVHDLDRHYIEALSDRPLQRYARVNLALDYVHINARYADLAQPLAATLKRLKQTFSPPQCQQGIRVLMPGETQYLDVSATAQGRQ